MPLDTIVAPAVGTVASVGWHLDGFERSLLVAAGIAFVGAVVAAVLVRPHEREERPVDAVSEIAA